MGVIDKTKKVFKHFHKFAVKWIKNCCVASHADTMDIRNGFENVGSSPIATTWRLTSVCASIHWAVKQLTKFCLATSRQLDGHWCNWQHSPFGEVMVRVHYDLPEILPKIRRRTTESELR